MEKEEIIKKIEDFIRLHKENVSLNKGTWMNEMEKYFEGEQFVIDELEKLLLSIRKK